MSVNLDNLLNGAGFEQSGRDALLDAEDDAFRCRHLLVFVSVWPGKDSSSWRIYAYCCGAELDGFERVFNLKEPAFRREGAADMLVAYGPV